MIQVSIKDSEGNECQLGDVIIQHFPNERSKYIGILTWYDDDACFRLSDGDGWHTLQGSGCRNERLCHINNCPALNKELGIIYLMPKQTISKIYQMVADAAIDSINSK